MEDEKLQKLYDVLAGKKLYTKSFEDFKGQFSNDKSQQKLYGVINKRKLYTKSLNEFQNQFFGASLKKKETTELPSTSVPTGSVSDSSQPKAQDTAQDTAQVPQTISAVQEQPVDESIAKLYDDYKLKSDITIAQTAQIDEKLEKQSKGERGFWETAVALTEGYLKTGFGIPMFRFDDKESLTQAREQQNQVNFLEALPEEKVQELRQYAGQEIANLDSENLNVLAENDILKEKSKQIANDLSYSKKAIETLKAEGKEVTQEHVDIFNNLKGELEGIYSKFNMNIDILESNTGDVDDFNKELALFKKNYGGLDYYQDLTRLTTAELMSGGMQLGVATNDLYKKYTGLDTPIDLVMNQEDVDAFRKEVGIQRELLKPNMTVDDIGETEYGFGKWLAEQIATQIPVLTTLYATGGTAGLGALGAAAAGQKISELKDSRTEAQEEKIGRAHV